ncbi:MULTISPECIES: hypothetical protein [Bacillota]|nr:MULTISPECIES: hypothetical protein [Bacillota]
MNTWSLCLSVCGDDGETVSIYGNFAAEMYYDTTPEARYMELWLPLSSSQSIMQIWIKTMEYKNNLLRFFAYWYGDFWAFSRCCPISLGYGLVQALR